MRSAATCEHKSCLRGEVGDRLDEPPDLPVGRRELLVAYASGDGTAAFDEIPSDLQGTTPSLGGRLRPDERATPRARRIFIDSSTGRNPGQPRSPDAREQRWRWVCEVKALARARGDGLLDSPVGLSGSELWVDIMRRCVRPFLSGCGLQLGSWYRCWRTS